MEELYIYMKHRSNKTRFRPALTMLEMAIAIAIMAIVFAVLVPQLRSIHTSWDAKAGDTEALQNGRILKDHLQHNLSSAARITAVSGPDETIGYIEFLNNDANSVRYDVNGITNYVQFGPVGNLADLAGPVSQLQFTCYNAMDLDTPITDVNSIRCVKVETTLTNSAGLGQDMTMATEAYIRTNALPATGGGINKLSEPWLEFDIINGQEPVIANMGGTKYLCTYRGDRDDGWACILAVNTADWSVDAPTFLEYDTKSGITPNLAGIKDSHALCAYQGDRGDGFVCILFEKIPGTLQRNVPLEFDTADCIYPVLFKIYTQGNDHHFLCAYFDNASSMRTLVLTASITDTVMQLTNGPTSSFACDLACQPALIKIDDTHHLCAYRGSNLRHWAVVLTVNPADWSVSTETPFEVTPSLYAYEPALAKIDDTHYLYALTSNIGQGCAVVLTVNTSDWTISKAMADPYYQFSDAAGSIELCQINNTSFLCAYTAGSNGLVTILTVNTSDWSMNHAAPFTFETSACSEPVLCKIDDTHFLCAYAGLDDDGYVGVLELSGGIMP
jgi:type II secretory pathway pseudopilin PulG/regulation of enolase protein 1 (concanavalin A-like superfamily)